MTVQEQDTVSFVSMNIILLGIVGVLVFGYFVLLIRKRWRQNFLHPDERRKDDDEKS